MTNLTIVQNTYHGINSGDDGKSLTKYLTPDASWTEAAGFPYCGTYIGADAIQKNVFQRIGSEWLDYKLEIEGYVADGDSIFAYGHYSGTYLETGKFFTARVAHLWKVKAGKIISFEQFVDSHIVQQTLLK
ncbi:nuclear transport factor 2 family protein [Vibrio aestuarianus]|uniref:Nuclear transport factor 2 family protein n=1 Tax=Vibrio aestuarianus TaxID=28171 RepID=A0A9X4EXH3_9VIBR|nr:nuclear transport factor 2 family protein [Vibrio aestuarianus]MDE1244194.1 nuclear transport factor 2 family protein [Vibrio aestuarianus]